MRGLFAVALGAGALALAGAARAAGAAVPGDALAAANRVLELLWRRRQR
jgi:hypothetical protein